MGKYFWHKEKSGIPRLFVSIMIFLSGVFLCACGSSEESVVQERTYEPRESLTLGCFIGEEYFYFKDELFATAAELDDMGVISGFDINAEYETMQEVWDALTQTRSRGETDFFFSKEDFYNYDEMSENDIRAMLENDSIDLLLVFGTAAGKLLTANAADLSYDYMVLGATDPISSGIIAGPEERYNEHSYAQVDTKRITRQIEGAYELFQFKDIGVVYEDNDAAYSYSGIGQLEAAAKEHGFAIHTRHVAESAGALDDERYYRELKAAYDDLQDEIDALYITTATIDSAMLPQLLSDLHDAGVITIAESSESQVEMGALMHISLADSTEDGQTLGHVLAEYAGGKPITEIDQVFEFAPKIYFNRETIEKTGVKLPMEMYLAADTIYPKEEE